MDASPFGGGVVRLDPLNNPEHMQALITSGLIWRSGPRVLQAAMLAIQNGEAQRRPDREPQDVRAFLDKVMGTGGLPEQAPGGLPQPEPESPVEDMGEPGEEPLA